MLEFFKNITMVDASFYAAGFATKWAYGPVKNTLAAMFTTLKAWRK